MISWWDNSSVALLFTWSRWLRLRHPTAALVNVYLPALSAILLAAVSLIIPPINMTGSLGVITQVNGLLQILAPFFVAALILVAGFPGDALDRPVGGIRPWLKLHGEIVHPSRREVLSCLFAYLAGVSMLLFVGGGMAVALSNPRAGSVLDVLGLLNGGVWARVAKAIYGGLLVHLFTITLLGLHFLASFVSSSRLQRTTDPTPSAPGDNNPVPLSEQRRRRSV